MINKKQNVLIAYALVMGTAFFTAFSYIFGKKVSEDLYPETVAFYWFFGAFLFAVIKRLESSVVCSFILFCKFIRTLYLNA